MRKKRKKSFSATPTFLSPVTKDETTLLEQRKDDSLVLWLSAEQLSINCSTASVGPYLVQAGSNGTLAPDKARKARNRSIDYFQALEKPSSEADVFLSAVSGDSSKSEHRFKNDEGIMLNGNHMTYDGNVSNSGDGTHLAQWVVRC